MSVPEPAESIPDRSWLSRHRARTVALRAIDSQLETARDDVNLLTRRGQLLEELGCAHAAACSYIEALNREPYAYVPMSRVPALLPENQAELARAILDAALARYPERTELHVRKAEMLLRDGDVDAARARCSLALTLEPLDRHARLCMAVISERSGDRAAAARHWKMWPSGMFTVGPYRGNTQPVRTLVLRAAQGGNLRLDDILDDRVFQSTTFLVESWTNATQLPPHDVVVNAIGDADRASSALELAGRALAGSTAPVVNIPSRVLLTDRVRNAERLGRIPGVVCPKIASFARDALEGDAGAALLAESGFRWPLLLRSPGFHSGQQFIMVRTPGEMGRALAALSSRDILAIAFVDTRGADGVFRKYRVMFIGGEVYPLHLAISTTWMVHYFRSEMAQNISYRDEESRFLENIESALAPAAIGALRAIGKSLDLDYAGVDFAIDRMGRVLIFEANATMAILPAQSDEQWDYRRPAIANAREGASAMILNRALRHGG